MEAILEATARVLSARGWAGTTTNHVAKKAGVSIGTLYEYFPNKEALVTALVERHLDAGEAALDALAEAATHARSSRELAGMLARTMIALHANDPRLHRTLFEETPHAAPLRKRVREIERAQAEKLAAQLAALRDVRPADTVIPARVIVDLLEALTHRWIAGIDGAPLPREVLEHELTVLVSAYVDARLT